MTGEPHTAPPALGLDSVIGEVADEFLRRQERGERPDPEEYAARYPTAAALIRNALQALRLVESSGGPNDSQTAAQINPMVFEPLGDYRIVREVGRGGMGIVYEAEQLSLGRRVALKVLPFAATMDPKQLQRFHNEAKAAASLRHEHIVHVYGVGCERGVHYFAMEFIDGITLAQAISGNRQAGLHEIPEDRQGSATGPYDGVANQLQLPDDRALGEPSLLSTPTRQPETSPVAALSTKLSGKDRGRYRAVAALIADAADALEHAHSLGIVHRDVKPGNLMVDVGGKLWVADFGLARFGADAGLTMSGALLGTLRYMAPEQALARHGLADHRVDVYGLGCTLYELLTGKPAVGGEDKADILRHIAFEEPVAPRKLDKAIPAELETIALKCLAKNPSERYATAGELADDLRRFCDDKPINAKPPGLRERSARWARRHRGFVAASLIILMLAVIGLSISTLLIWQKDREIQRAYENESQERTRAQVNLRTARAAIDQMLTRLGRERLADVPQMEQVRAEVLQDAVRLYERLLREHDTDPAARAELAKVYGLVAVNLDRLGRKPESQTASRECIRMYQKLADEFPANTWYRSQLAGALNDLGIWLNKADQLVQAEEIYRQAIDRQESVVRDDPHNPNYRVFLANMQGNLGQLLNYMYKFVPAEQARRRAIALREELVSQFPDDDAAQHLLSRDQSGLGDVLTSLRRFPEAEQAYQTALATQEKLVEGQPANAEFRKSLAGTLNEQARLLRSTGRLPEAENAYKKTLRHLQKLAADFPHTPGYRSQTGHVLSELGSLQAATGRPADGQDALRQALAVFESLKAEFPQQLRYGHYVADTLGELVRCMRLPGQSSDAADALRKAIALEEKLVAAFPQDPEYRPFLAKLLNDLAWHLATCLDVNARDARGKRLQLAQSAMANTPAGGAIHNTLGVALYRAGNWKDSAAELEKSIELNKAGGAVDWYFLAMAHWQLGDKDQARKNYAQAVEWMETKKWRGEELRRFQAEAAELLGIKVGEDNQPPPKP